MKASMLEIYKKRYPSVASQKTIQPPVEPAVELPAQPPVMPPVEPPVEQPVKPPVELSVEAPVQPAVEPPAEPPVEDKPAELTNAILSLFQEDILLQTMTPTGITDFSPGSTPPTSEPGSQADIQNNAHMSAISYTLENHREGYYPLGELMEILDHMMLLPTPPCIVNMLRVPLYTLIHDFYARYKYLRSLPHQIWREQDMPTNPAPVISPIHLHSKLLATLIYKYDTCSASMKDRLKWTICLQAAMVSAYCNAAHRQPGLLMQSHQIRTDGEPSPILIYVDDAIMPWNQQDCFILNCCPPVFHSDPTADLWDDLHQAITTRLKRDGFYQIPYPVDDT